MWRIKKTDEDPKKVKKKQNWASKCCTTQKIENQNFIAEPNKTNIVCTIPKGCFYQSENGLYINYKTYNILVSLRVNDQK